MRFGCSLYLSDFAQRLVVLTHLRVSTAHWDWITPDPVVHKAVTSIAIVRNCQRLEPLLANCLKPSPQIFGLDRIQSSERIRGRSTSKDYVAVEICTEGHRRPFVTDEGRKSPRAIMVISNLDLTFPSCNRLFLQFLWHSVPRT